MIPVIKLYSTGSSAASQATRVMIFCQYRDIVREITELLQRHRPHVRPMQFVGHAPSTNPNNDEKTGAKPNRRFTQKDQLLVSCRAILFLLRLCRKRLISIFYAFS